MRKIINTAKLNNKNIYARKFCFGYVLCVLFLLCYFFAFSPENTGNPLQRETETTYINIMVPQGTQIEIKGENASVSTLFFKQESKTNQNHFYKNLFVLILCFLLLLEGYFFAQKKQDDAYFYKKLFIIDYIHSLDGKK